MNTPSTQKRYHQQQNTAVADNLDIFRKEFLNANSWAQRKDGVPLYLLDNLTSEELKTAENELINAISLGDNWPIVGLGHIKSKDALPVLNNILKKSKGAMKVTIAHSIFQIGQDVKMIEVVLDTMPGITNPYELVDILHYLPDFNDKRTIGLLQRYREHNDYLVAYNATRYLGLPTEDVVEKFRARKKHRSLWDKLLRR